MLRMGGNLDRGQPQALQRLEQAVVGRRLDRDAIPRFARRAQCEVKRLHAATRRDDFVHRQLMPGVRCAQRNLPAEFLVAGWEVVVVARVARVSRGRGEHAIQRAIWQDLRTRRGHAKRRVLRVMPEGDDDLGHLGRRALQLDLVVRVRLLQMLRLGQQMLALRLHVIAGLRPRFDQAAAFEQLKRLQCRGPADALLGHQLAHGRDPVPRPQDALADELRDLLRHLFVKVGGCGCHPGLHGKSRVNDGNSPTKQSFISENCSGCKWNLLKLFLTLAHASFETRKQYTYEKQPNSEPGPMGKCACPIGSPKH